MIDRVPETWRDKIEPMLADSHHRELQEFLETERREHAVYPAQDEELYALECTPWPELRVVILGQDPYHGPNQAHGLAFSVRGGTALPRSLTNIFRELVDDVNCESPLHGNLEHWARQGVLLLNAVLTVRAGEPNSHAGRGWEQITDAVIRTADAKPGVVFVLWGQYAQRKAVLIDRSRHAVIESAHPSPLSARRGFFGSRPFTRVNAALAEAGLPEIDWRIPAHP